MGATSLNDLRIWLTSDFALMQALVSGGSAQIGHLFN
jgi:hypothetical protein